MFPAGIPGQLEKRKPGDYLETRNERFRGGQCYNCTNGRNQDALRARCCWWLRLVTNRPPNISTNPSLSRSRAANLVRSKPSGYSRLRLARHARTCLVGLRQCRRAAETQCPEQKAADGFTRERVADIWRFSELAKKGKADEGEGHRCGGSQLAQLFLYIAPVTVNLIQRSVLVLYYYFTTIRLVQFRATALDGTPGRDLLKRQTSNPQGLGAKYLQRHPSATSLGDSSTLRRQSEEHLRQTAGQSSSRSSTGAIVIRSPAKGHP